MIINRQWLEKYRACEKGKEFFLSEGILSPKKGVENLIAKNKLDWAHWLLARIFTREQKIKYALYAAEQVLELYEVIYPKSKRPRAAIEAALNVLKNPSSKNTKLAIRAYRGAFAAADAAYAKAYSAAYADAAYAKAYSAAYAAEAARATAYTADYAFRTAVNTAAYTAYTAEAARAAVNTAFRAAHTAAHTAAYAAEAARAAVNATYSLLYTAYDISNDARKNKILSYGVSLLSNRGIK